MSANWPTTTLGAICSNQNGAIQTGPFGSQLHTSDYKASGIPVVMPTNICDGGIVEDGIARISDEDANRLSQHILRMGDIVFSRRGDVTKNALIRSREVGWFCGTGCLKVRLGDESLAIAEFISHYLRLPEVKEWLIRHAVGATMPNLNTGILSAVPICLPPINEQKWISKILGDLDSKISISRQTNQTLERIAQSIFKSWFVDFDPVKAKIAALETGGTQEAAELAAMCVISGKNEAQLAQLKIQDSDAYLQLAQTAALFPAAMQESELGEIPVGWKVSKLGEYLTIKRGGSPRPIQDFMADTGLPWVKIADATAESSPFLFSTKEFIKESGLSKTVLLKKGSLILTNSATPGLPKFLELDACIHDGWLYFPERNLFSDEYLYFLFLKIRIELVAQGNGSVFTNLKTDILKSQRAITPTAQIMESFSKIIKSILDNIRSNSEEIRTLSQLRDSLLPKLLSGEIDLAEIAFKNE